MEGEERLCSSSYMCRCGFMAAYIHTPPSEVMVFHDFGEALLKEVFGAFGIEVSSWHELV